ncbi:PREDICTED: protein PLASTID MOVEMENT IMPAIRED 2-like isoform X2 [Camelina sativa]|uniref:Protein PLASTID MOVEMENT IMPAIRED 2-like isoform X1 n=1 Tax=Camelina sativa TaxID=90675 RepID=A0ABM0WFZ4_CAMSA|nr:PREDICTED: protein PLASTID MOVEMENT IMPAIRED 2-like isoform X1 [Camelina sativa]XP_010470556.1 PREDICTED: protein PLASTID MOVEMENT IMPAIRED 2-like isoform X1 [Camelina sativa]XP_010470558.1 PREDICTED: protein PLASTID MOVEMENT IMPAIRED 2-like isoform X2 [Camelina sativa]
MADKNLGGTVSVKAAINKYGQRATGSVSPQLDLPVIKTSSVAENLHKSGRELGMYRESRRVSEFAKAKAEAELFKAKEIVKELTLRIEESKQRLKSRFFDTEAVMKESRIDGNAGIMRELEDVKQELSKLKLDIAYVSREKDVAEKEVMELSFKMEENLKLLESLKLEVDVANEEHVLVELAKIEALKECKEVEEERDREQKEVSESLNKRKKRIREMMREIERSKNIENELSETLSDIEMLEMQLKLVKEMERKVQRSDSMSRSKNRGFERGKDVLSVLKEITEATEAKKEELASINAELFCLVNTMDTLRQELEQAKQETTRFEKMIQKDDIIIERLNSKMLIAKDQLEGVSAAEERISSLADNLTTSFEKLKNDREAAKKEELELKEEATVIKSEVQKTEIGIGGKEKELLSKLDELEKAKHAEVLALEKLESLAEKTMDTREMESQRNSTITISRFEYEYLSGQACHAKETAEKKVEAAMAWVEALKASTNAIMLKTESLKRVSGKTMVEEERASFRMQRSLSIKRLVQDEIQKFKQNSEDYGVIRSPKPKRKSIQKFRENSEDKGLINSPRPIRKSARLSGKFTPVQGGKSRRYSSGNRGTPTFFVIKKKKKVPNLVKFFSRKRRKSSLEQ